MQFFPSYKYFQTSFIDDRETKMKATGSVGVGLVAVFAVSGSVVFIARQLHKHLLSDFLKKIEFELCGSSSKFQAKKRVRFADDTMEDSSWRNKEYSKVKHGANLEKLQGKALGMSNSMPLNRQVLYKGILQYKALKTRHI
ncbi:uncharacterized protein LOC120181103 [Hibiscus syriacus]|uniref:uncharacterized protein LOC120181103 n=1 Tax=Hibiscus syriacus TaxID=106335 RepID=UPI001924077E|nr:uncharacterized protein LOC120181103 [Hibiscus syriacus]